ncbi:MAG: peptidyl-prolyl cis-trans isomerase [Ignavibacteria bacterium]
MNLKKYLFFIVFLFSITACAQVKSSITKDDTIVAKIGNDYLVTAEDLRQYVKDWKYEYRFRIKSEAYKKALNGLIRDRLRVFDFFDRRLEENQDLMAKIRRIINDELMNAFYDKSFVDKYANEKAAAEAYKKKDKEIICNDIILPMPADPTKELIDSLRTIALRIETDLSRNYDVENLIKSYSLKSFNLKDKRKVTWWDTMLDPVANVIFRLQKGFTRVVESVDGFHIVKVLEIRKIKLEPFEKMKDQIISQLQKGYYQAYNNAYEEFRRGLIDKSSIKWNQSGLDQIVKWSSEDAQFYGGAYKDTIENAIRNGNNFEILSYNNGNVDLKEYLRLLEEVVFLNPNIVLSSVSVKDFILDALYDNSVVTAAKKLGLEKKLIDPYTQNPVIADRLLYLYNQAVIEGSIPKGEPEELHKFYEDHKDPIFYQLKVVYIYARIYTDSAKAAADINEIKKGTPFEKVSNAWLVKMFIRERDGSLKAYRTSGGDYLAKAAFELTVNESAGPIEYYDSTKVKQFAVIKCFQIQPEKQLTYDDVKGKRIEEEFKNYYRQRISDEVDARLKKKYSVEIFEDVLSETIASK